jgi:hypothetical protein
MPFIVSEKDRLAPTLAQWLADPRSKSFQYAGEPVCRLAGVRASRQAVYSLTGSPAYWLTGSPAY